MKRNPDLMRAILIALEEKPDSTGILHPRELVGWDVEAISYELRLLNDAGLVVATVVESPGAPVFCLGKRLTAAGHDLLDKIRSESQWASIRRLLRERGLDVSIEMVKAAAGVVLEHVLRGGPR